MKVFVTGGTGFVGSHLVETLLKRGDEVTCLVRDPAKFERLFPNQAPRMVAGTLGDEAALETACADVDVVFHVAGLTAARGSAEYFEINGTATRRVAEVARRAAPRLTRLVYVSSVAACGPTRRGMPLTESVTPQPVSDYGRSKLAGERAIQESGLPWTIVRPPTVYGPRDAEVFKVFKVAKLGLAPVFGTGQQENSFIYVRDLVRALLASVAPNTIERVYFAAHPETWTQRELVAHVYRAIKTQPRTESDPFVIPIPSAVARGALWMAGTAASLLRRPTVLSADRANDFLAEAWVCSSAALTADAGWEAETDLITGLGHTAQWYRDAGWL